MDAQIAAVSSSRKSTESDQFPSDGTRATNVAAAAVCNAPRRREPSPFPGRNAELIALVNGPERMTDGQIAEAMFVREGQVTQGLRKLRLAGVKILRESFGGGRPPNELLPADPRFGVTEDWPAEKIAALRALWADTSLSTAEIGRRLRVSKNAIVGKAHRLGLQGRLSPIIRDLTRVRAHVALPRAGRHTLPPLASGLAPPPPPESRIPDSAPRRLVPLALNRPLAAPRPASPVTYAAAHVSRTGRVTECCWPIGEPGTRAFRFCDAPSDPGRSYCHDHSRTAFVEIRHRARQVDDGYARPVPP